MSPKKSDCSVYAVWATAWGPMAAAGGPRGLARVVLPHYQRRDLAELMAFEHPAATDDEAAFAELIELSRAYFNGRRVGFDDVACDLPPPGRLAGRVLRACREIPYGQRRSYKQLAAAAGTPGKARPTAGVLSRNRLPLVIPCHRVTYADGRPGGFSAPAGVELKRRMLQLEQAC